MKFQYIKESLDRIESKEDDILAQGDDVLGKADEIIVLLHADKRTLVQETKRSTLVGEVIICHPNAVKFGETIGTGGFSVVYRGTFWGIQVALKVFRNHTDGDALTRLERESCENEAILMRLALHPNIIACYGLYHDEYRTVIVQELAKGSVWSLLRDRMSFPIIPDVIFIVWFWDACAAVVHLHSKGIVHKDLKCENFLVVSHGNVLRVKLGDFGLSKLSMSFAGMASALGAGTTAFMSPELRNGGHATGASDVFALGVSLIQMITRQGPIVEDLRGQIRKAVAYIMPSSLLYSCEQDIEGLLLGMLDTEASKRPKAYEVLEKLTSIIERCGGDPRLNSSSLDYIKAIEIDNVLSIKAGSNSILKASSGIPMPGVVESPDGGLVESNIQIKRKYLLKEMIGWLEKNVRGIRPEDCIQYAELFYEHKCGDMTRVAGQIKVSATWLDSLGILQVDAADIKAALLRDGLLGYAHASDSVGDESHKSDVETSKQITDASSISLRSHQILPLLPTENPTPPAVSQVRMDQILELKAMNLSVKQCLKLGFSLPELKLVDHWFSLSDYLEAGCSVKDLYEVGFRDQLIALNVPIDKSIWESIFDSGIYSLEQLKFARCPGIYLKEFGVRPNELLDVGFLPRDIYTIEESKAKFSDFEVICKMGYSTDEIRSAFTIEELKTQNVPVHVMREFGYKIKTEWRLLDTYVGEQTNYVWTQVELSNGVLATVSDGKTVTIWEVSSGTCLNSLTGHSSTIKALVRLRNGLLASGSGDTTVKVWDVSTGACLNTLVGHSDCVWTLVELSNGLLASGAWDKTIKLWDVDSGVCLKTIRGHTSDVKALVQLPSGLLASGSDDKTIKLWDISSTTCLDTLTGHSGGIRALIKLSNGLLASGSSDNTIRLWDAISGTCLNTLIGHSSTVWTLLQLSSGVLASGSQDTTIKLWDISGGSCLNTLTDHTNTVFSIIQMSNGVLASGSNNEAIKLWEEIWVETDM